MKDSIMDPTIFQVIKLIFGILIAIIGFYTRQTIKEVKDELKEYKKELKELDDQINENSLLIEINTNAIKVNSDSNRLNREFLSKTLDEFKDFISAEISTVKRDIKELTKELYQKQTN